MKTFDITEMGLEKGTNLAEPIYFPIEEQMAKTFYEYALIAVYPSKVFITKEVEKLAADVINAGFDSYKVFNALRIRENKFDDVGNEYIEFLHIEEAKEAIRKLTEGRQESNRRSSEGSQKENRKERLLKAIMRTYQKEDVCMEELLAGLRVKGFSILDFAEVYARAMYLANGDKCFIIKENERHPMWIW